MKILFLGDVVGKFGLKLLEENIASLRQKYKPNMIIINGENVTNGKGLSQADYKKLMGLNISAITMGNHTFRYKNINEYIDKSKIVRPLNFKDVKGNGYLTINFNNKSITIINLIGQVLMHTNEEVLNPFLEVEKVLKEIKSDYIIVDMHAEVTSEKLAMAYYLDGRVDAVVGTHTHIQTNDARVLDNKTLYISDLGMCGSYDSILGVKKEIIIDRFVNSGQDIFKLEEKGKGQINGALLDLDLKTIQIVKELYQ